MIELKQVDGWKRSIEAISSFISEGNFRFNESGIHLRAIDPSQIVMVDFLMPRASFERFDVEPNFVGIDLVELSKIVSRALPSERLKMDLTDSELFLHLSGEFDKSFKLPLIDVSEEDLALPKHKAECTVEINARILKEALKDASIFGSAVVFKTVGKQFFVEARGSNGQLVAVSKDSKHIRVSGSKDVLAKFSLNFLQNIIKEAGSDEDVLIELKSDSPMKISFPIAKNELRFFLAPMLL
ncbi:MAG: hypothetical protein AABW85_04230 [archaeon]